MERTGATPSAMRELIAMPAEVEEKLVAAPVPCANHAVGFRALVLEEFDSLVLVSHRRR